MIDKFSLPTIKHLKPYSLQWLKKGNDVIMSKQALVAFTIRDYKDRTGYDPPTYGCSSFAIKKTMVVS